MKQNKTIHRIARAANTLALVTMLIGVLALATACEKPILGEATGEEVPTEANALAAPTTGRMNDLGGFLLVMPGDIIPEQV